MKRFADESAVEMTSGQIDMPRNSFTVTRDADLWGGDLRSGLTDPLLAGITEKQCAALCLATQNCGAFTYNRTNGETCFLKTGGGRLTRFAGATTGVLNRQHLELPPPPTRGPAAVLDDGVQWRDGDTLAGYAARIRQLSQPLGRDCRAERDDLAQLVGEISANLPDATAVAGQAVTFGWGGNVLVERIPVWVMLRTPGPARFEGVGVVPLGPVSPNPFGLETGAGETRALVALAARGAGVSGTMNVRPLRAGTLPVTLTLVAFLRACEEEVLLAETAVELEVAPAPAQIVIGTGLGQRDLTHALDLPEFDRRIELSETRVRVETLSDGTEIVERDGRDAHLSPTGRFLSVFADNRHAIIDVIDGAEVTSVQSETGQMRWGAGDAVVFGSVSPWGKVDLALPFGERLVVENQLTGPSCCVASPDMAQISVDLENGILAVRGNQGHWFGPIQGNALSKEYAGDGYSSSGAFSGALQLVASSSMGTVAPVSVALGHDVPGGAVPSRSVLSVATPITRPAAEAPRQLASLTRGAGGGTVGTFERIGIEVLEGLASTPIIDGYVEHIDNRYKPDRSPEVLGAIHSALEQLASPHGWSFNLLNEPPQQYHASDCFAYLTGGEAESTGQTEFAQAGAIAVPATVFEIDVIERASHPLLIGRAECSAGATLGSLRGRNMLFVADLSGPQPPSINELAVMEASWLGNNRTPQFQEAPVIARLFDRTLLLFTPGNGGIAVFDLDLSEVTQVWHGLPSGDLMEDAFLTQDLRHVLQANRDGGFYVHRISDGAKVLAGRIVDDEIAVWTPDYRFDATSEAAQSIDLRFPGIDGQFSLDRFDPVLHAPGLAQRALAGDLPGAQNVPVPPALTARLSAEGGAVRIEAHLIEPRGAVVLRVLQDGVETDRVPIAADTVSTEVARLPGARHASVVAVTVDGLTSNPVSADLGPETAGGIRRVLAVAVDLYADERLSDLNYAKADADRLMQTFSAMPVGVPGFEEPRFVGGRRAGPDDVLTAINDTLAGLGPADHAVLFFAGHGLETEGDFYLALSGTDPERLAETALQWDAVAARIAASPARVTVLIDACHSGAAGTGLFATNDSAVGGLARLPANLTVLAASKGRQQSIEAPEVAGGLFSVALQRVLLTERAQHDVDGNGRIEVSELANGVRRIVEGQSGGLQVPWLTRSRIGGDHALF